VSTNVGWSADRRSRPAATLGSAQRGARRVRGGAQQYRLTLNASYRLPFGDRVRLSGSHLINQPVGGAGGRRFRESRLSLRYQHSF
jgi:hypothetical protein